MNDIRKELQKLVSQNQMNNDFLYDYIIVKEIKHTSNKNGIFINLSGIDDKIINDMYEYTNKMSVNIQTRDIKSEQIKEKKEIHKKSYKPLPCFNSIQNQILEMSKTI